MESDNGLSWEEKNQLYGLTFVPIMITMFAFLFYFLFYLKPNNLAETIWDYIAYLILPSFLVGGPSSFFTFEVLHHRKVKQPLTFRVKRFSGRVLFMISVGLSLCGALALSELFLSPIVGNSYAMVGGIIYMVGFFLVITTFREFFSKLEKGEW